MSDLRAALLSAIDRLEPDLQSVLERAGNEDEGAAAGVDERAMQQFLRAFCQLLREGVDGGRTQRDLVFEAAVPALVARGQSATELLESHVRTFVALAPALLELIDAAHRDGAITWLSAFAGSYVREVTEIARTAEGGT